MKRGSCADFHSAGQSSLVSTVNRVWKVCKSRRESPGTAKRYLHLRQMPV